MSQPDLNLANIENLKRIYQTESSILWSRAQSVQIQSLVEETANSSIRILMIFFETVTIY